MGQTVAPDEFVRLLEENGFTLVKQKGSVRHYGKAGHPRLIRVDDQGPKEVPTGTCRAILKAAAVPNAVRSKPMVDLPYSLVIEATDEPDYFGFYSPELEGFSGIGHSVEDCLYQARWGMKEHVELLAEQRLPVPPPNPDPVVTLRNEKKGEAPNEALQPTGAG